MKKRGFSLVELLVVVSIIAALVAILLPALSKARQHAQKIVCASNLRQMGNALLIYVGENRQHLPMVIEPLWMTVGVYDFNADPFNSTLYPYSFATFTANTMKNTRLLECPSARLGSPFPETRMSYRVSSANNFDWQVKTEEQLLFSPNSAQYGYSLKYLNGRKYRLKYVDAFAFPPLPLLSGVGPYYIVRDYVITNGSGVYTAPHSRNFNQLKLDMSVSLEKEASFGFTYP